MLELILTLFSLSAAAVILYVSVRTLREGPPRHTTQDIDLLPRNRSANPVFGFPQIWDRTHTGLGQFSKIASLLLDLSGKVVKAAEEKAADLDQHQLVTYCLTALTASSFQELLVLAESGCGQGAMKIARGMFESMVYADYLAKNPAEAEDYIDFLYVILRKRIEYIEKHKNVPGKPIDPETKQGILDGYKQVKWKFTDRGGRIRNQWHAIAFADMAKQVGAGELYDGFYRLACSIHHANMEALLGYIEDSENLRFSKLPSMDWVPEALLHGHAFLLRTLGVLNECCNLGLEAEIGAAEEEFKQLEFEAREVNMSERTCDSCGKKKDLAGGKTCDNGHFICKDCVYSGVIFISEKTSCPLCGAPLS
jgi:rubrerythrin